MEWGVLEGTRMWQGKEKHLQRLAGHCGVGWGYRACVCG